jgi:hypothetical protein
MDEFSAAMMTAVKQGDPYILPILMDDVRVPPDLLHPHIHYLRAEDYSPEELAKELAKKVGKSAEAGTPPAALGPVVEHALRVRLPKIVPDQWSKYKELDRAFDHLATRFKEAGHQLRMQGFICTINRNQDRLNENRQVSQRRINLTLGAVCLHMPTTVVGLRLGEVALVFVRREQRQCAVALSVADEFD